MVYFFVIILICQLIKSMLSISFYYCKIIKDFLITPAVLS